MTFVYVEMHVYVCVITEMKKFDSTKILFVLLIFIFINEYELSLQSKKLVDIVYFILKLIVVEISKDSCHKIYFHPNLYDEN